MDNKQLRVDAYGRFTHVPEYPEAPNASTAVPEYPEAPNASTALPLSEPDWAECEEVWARVERVKRLEDKIDRVSDILIMVRASIDTYRERLTKLEEQVFPPIERVIKSNWVEKELEAIKNLPNERVCQWCKWGVFEEINRDEVWCHYDPEGIGRPKEYWCSRWEEK